MRGRRVARIAAKVVLGAMAAAAFLLVVALGALRTEWGSDLVRRKALEAVGQTLSGTASARSFRYHGDRIVLEGVMLRDPEGKPVLSAERLAVRFSPLAFLRRQVALSDVELTAPTIAVVKDPRGTNLARALAPRTPPKTKKASTTKEKQPGGAGWTIRVGQLRVRGGELSYRDLTGAKPVVWHVRGLAVDGEGRLSTGGGRFAGDVAVGGTAVQPLRAPLKIDVRGEGDAERVRAALSFALGDTLVRAKVDGAGGVHGVTLEELIVGPRVAAAVAGLRLAGPIRARGEGKVGPEAVQGSLQAFAGGARIDARGTYTAKPAIALAATVDGREIDLSRILEGAPRSRFDLDVDAKAAGRTMQTLAGEGTVTVSRGRLGDRPFGPITLAGRARARSYDVVSLSAALPGVTLTGSGKMHDDTVDASARVLATDLRLLGSSLASRQRRAGLPLAGRGELTVSARGPAKAPRIDVRGRFPALAFAENRIRALAMQATMPRGTALPGTRASVTAEQVVAGGRDLGRVMATVTAGARDRLDLTAQVTKPEPARVAARVHLDRPNRVRGTMEAAAVGARADGRFDVPTVFPPPAGARLALELTTSDVDLARVGKLLVPPGRSPPARGRMTARISITGTGARPVIDAQVATRQLVVDDQAAGDVRVTVKDPARGPLEARVDVVGLGDPGHLVVRTALETGELLRRPAARELDRLLARPLEVEARLPRVPLSALARMARYADPVKGDLALQADLRGTPLDPRGDVTVKVAGAATGRFPPTNALLALRSTAEDVTAKVQVTRRDRTLLAADARLGLPSGRRDEVAALMAAPVRLRAQLGPLWLQRLGLPPETDDSAPRTLRGKVDATVALDGSLRAPRLTMDARAHDVALDKQPLGRAVVAVRYADAKPTVNVVLHSLNGGALRIDGSAKLDLSVPAVQRGLPPSPEIPIQANVSAKGFDLAWLSGVVRTVPTVAGQLDARVTAAGPLSAPKVNGQAEWRDGRVLVTQLGMYDGIHLAIRGDGERIELTDLSAKSGAGYARVSGRAVRAGDRGYDLTASAKMHEFLVRQAGQPVAAVSLEAKARGSFGPDGVKITPLTIDEAHVVVADAPRKNLQKLERPADVVLMKDGEPLNRKHGRKLAALRRRETADAAAPAAASAGGRPLLVRIAAPRNLWVRAKDANLELGLSNDFRFESDGEPRVFGQVHVRRGFVNVLGRRFVVEDSSTVRFAGPADEPTLDVRAKYVAEQANVTVFVELVGTQSSPKFTLTSEPPHPQTQLVTLLLTGRMDLDEKAGSTSPEQRAVSVVGGVLAKQLQKTLVKRLPLDVLNIQTGQGLTSTVLEAGTYLSDDVYVAYVGRLGADPMRYENQNAVHLEYQITSRWSFAGEYGDARTGAADLIWKKHY